MFKPLNIRSTLADGASVSIQASKTHYCRPRSDVGPYTALELGYPDFVPTPELLEFIECAGDPMGSVYGYVPVEVVEAEIAAHGGLLDNNGEVVPPSKYWWRS